MMWSIFGLALGFLLVALAAVVLALFLDWALRLEAGG